MFIHQVTGYNYDATQYLMALSLFVLILNLLQKKKLSLRDLALLITIYIFFLITKLSYEPMLFLVFVIPRNKIAFSFLEYVKKVSFILITIVSGYVLFKFSFFISSSGYTHHPKEVNPLAQLQYILQNPINYLSIFVQSSVRLAKFHMQGIIGIFGWLDYSMDWWVYLMFVCFFLCLVYAIKPNKKEQLQLWQILLIPVSLFLTYAFMMTIFYLNWKTVGSSVIDGTQGRYFIVFTPFVLYFLIHLKNYLVHNSKFRFPDIIPIQSIIGNNPLILKIGSVLISSLVVHNIVMAIIKRYY